MRFAGRNAVAGLGLMVLATAAGLGLGTGPAAAANEDAGLYAPAPPPGASFLRVINAGGEAAIPVTIDGKPAGDVAGPGASPYVVVEEGTRGVVAGGATAEFPVAQAKFYSVVVGGEGAPKLIEDQSSDNRAKALIVLLNLTDKAGLALKTGDGKTAIIDGAAPGEPKSRVVNGANVHLGVFDGSTMVADLGTVKVERGSVYTAIATGTGAATRGAWVVSTTAPLARD